MGKLYKVIGLMSGTSLDGVDIAYCHFEQNQGNWQFQILDTETVEYPDDIRDRIKDTLKISGENLVRLDLDLGWLYGELVVDFIDRYNIEVDFISSHGHTIYHQPKNGFTYQAGNGLAMMLKTGLTVVYDFRSQDLLLKGQGAPLVPIGDKHLFSEYSACINLGGIANISYEKTDRRIAYDICPANMPLNIMARTLDIDFDEDGKIARSGKVDESLIKTLTGLGYYREAAPKSLGFEWVAENIITKVETSDLRIEDKLCTLVEHTAERIANELSDNKISGKVLLTGGGALNKYLVERMIALSPQDLEFEIPDNQLVIYKEALIFGFMGVLRIRNEVNTLSSVTGSTRDHCSGVILQP